ncbi:F0F1 ATP synthase subunit epsilon [Candidatus Margulisiibacteriota bacterium]
MPETFELEIITPQKVALKKDVSYLRVPGTEGNLGVYPDHSPLLTTLDTGAVYFEDLIEGAMEPMFISGGFIEVLPEKVTIMADLVEWQKDIDLERAEGARKRAEERLRSKDTDVNLRQAEAALKRSLYRIMVKHG